MRIIQDILNRLARVERNADQFVAEFDTGIAIAKNGSAQVRLVELHSRPFGDKREGIAYFQQERKPVCDYIEVDEWTGNHRFMKHQKDIEVDAEGNPVTAPAPTDTVAAAAPKVKKTPAKKRSVYARNGKNGVNQTHIDSFLNLEQGQVYDIPARSWRSTPAALTSALGYHGKKNGRKFSLRTRGNHFIITRVS